MRYRTFPESDLQASEVGFGVWTVTAGWWGDYSDAAAAALLRKAFGLGITFFDTADTYGNGRGEEIMPKALGKQRQEIVISTKVGYDFYSNPGQRTGQREWPQNWSREFVKFACEQSLKRLGTDYIDLYQLHNARMDAIDSDELFATLEELRREGKIRYYGVALGPAIGWREEGLAAMQRRDFTALQIIHNLLEQDPGRDFMPAARRNQTGIMVRVPHSSGMLEGNYTLETTFPPEDHRSHRPRQWLVDGLKKLERLRFLHEGRDKTLGQAAIKWLLAEPLVATVLPNIYDEEQLVEFAAAPEVADLTAEELARVAELYDHNFYLEQEPAAETAAT
ncbi:MAG: aldo/keto reductase [Chloroflexi bacterium]|nr:aldo/keto reductase [Chloroflexota bacterium]